MTYFTKAISNAVNTAVALTQGLYLTESGTPDMNVNYSPGLIRNGETYYYTKAGSTIAVSAADADYIKLAIIQKVYNANSAPTVKYGTPVGTMETPAYPTPDANNIIIGYVGDTSVPLQEDTDAIVEGTPTGTQVQLIPVNTYRL